MNGSGYRNFAAVAAVALAMHSGAVHAASNIVLDGSLGKGPAGALVAVGTVAHSEASYARIAIPESYGLRSGANVFHSFSAFSIGSGDAAVFSLGAPAANVVSRVTGGQASAINGLLKLDAGATGSAPNFVFINPAGIAFGAGAAIDVPAALHLSTANYLKFPDGNFYADTAHTSTFSAAAPEAFGFLGTTRSSITVTDGAYLATNAEQPFSIVAGDVDVAKGGTIATTGGDIRIAANGLAIQEVPVTGSLPPGQGEIAISGAGNVSAWTYTAARGGNISVSAGRIALADGMTSINTMAGDAGDAGDISVAVTGPIILSDGATIASKTFGTGNAGTIAVHADGIVIDGKNSTFATGIVAENGWFCAACGRPGNISVSATKDLTLLNGAVIWSQNCALSAAGSVTVSAGNIALEGVTSISADSSPFGTGGDAGDVAVSASGNIGIKGGRIASDSFTAGHAGKVSVSAGNHVLLDSGNISSGTYVAGHGGSVEVHAGGTLSLLKDGMIQALTYGSGDAGSVKIGAGNLKMAGGDESNLPNINTLALGGSGNGGSVEISVSGDASLLGWAAISSSTATAGHAGTVTVKAGSLVMDGVVDINSSAGKNSSGNAGSVSIDVAGALSVTNGARISSSTSAAGRAGSVTINAGDIVVAGSDKGTSSSIGAWADAGSSGQTGNVAVTSSGTVWLATGGQLSVQNDATVAAPGLLTPTVLSVAAPGIVLKDAKITAASTGNAAASNVRIRFTDQLALDPSSITTSANLGNGGAIDIAGNGLLLLDRSQITTSVSGSAGNGGDIGIRTKSLVMTTGFVQANTAAEGAKGGNVYIDVQNLVPSGNVLLRGGQLRHVFQPDIFGFNVIQAAAPTGLSGTIDITAPSLDISGTVAGLGARMLDAGGLGRNPCRIGGGSSLVQAGRGGFAPSARGLLGASERAPDPAASASGVSAWFLSPPCRG